MSIFKIQLPMVLLVDLALLFVGCSSSQQTAAPGTTAQRSTNAVSTDPQVNAILEQSCYQCHSTGGSGPWYASVSPTYLAANSARRVLNFSENIEQTVSSGSMPPRDYTALDHSARLADDQKQALLKWASQAALPAHGPGLK
jgi:uncharacterized membrane protein